jgi:hypothetical protein
VVLALGVLDEEDAVVEVVGALTGVVDDDEAVLLLVAGVGISLATSLALLALEVVGVAGAGVAAT